MAISWNYLAVCCGLLLNFVFSISIIQLNKYIYVNYGFPSITLTCIHFVATSIGLGCFVLSGVFKPVFLPMIEMLPMAFTFCCFVVFSNMSLKMNTVEAYQCIKMMNIPIVMAVSAVIYKQTFSKRIKLSVVSSSSSFYFCLRVFFQYATGNVFVDSDRSGRDIQLDLRREFQLARLHGWPLVSFSDFVLPKGKLCRLFY
jgi:hypothetical protein